MQAGRLRHSVSLQRAVEAQDKTGQVTQAWTTLSTVWARIVPLDGIEIRKGFATRGEETHEVTIRSYSGLTPKDRILYGTRILHIVSVSDKDERGIEMLIRCKEKVS